MTLEVIVKLNNYCNLACDYCYFEAGLATASEIAERSAIDVSLAASVGRRTREFLDSHNQAVAIVYHGGEPLLYGKQRFRSFHHLLAGELRGRDVRYALQTNGTVLDEEWIDLFIELDVAISVSFDGTLSRTSRHRPDHGGRSSFQNVLGSVKACVAARDRGLQFNGTLAVIMPGDDESVLQHLSSLGVNATDFLLPHGKEPLAENDQERIGTFLGKEFAGWFADPLLPDVRLFSSIVSVAMGGPTFTDSIAGDHADAITIYPTGHYGVIDTLSLCDARFGPTSLSILSHSFQEFLAGDTQKDIQAWRSRPPDDCLSCEYVHLCGGGSLADRYRDRSFNHRSANCRSLKALFSAAAPLLYDQDAAS